MTRPRRRLARQVRYFTAVGYLLVGVPVSIASAIVRFARSAWGRATGDRSP